MNRKWAAVTGAVLGLLLPLGTASADPDDVHGTVVGGTEASTKDYPWMVYLAPAENDHELYCGGSLVAPTKVLTAAHCMFDKPEEYKVVAGRDVRSSDAGVVVGVERIWVHPEYEKTGNHDVAVMTLKQPLPYRPVSFAGPLDRWRERPGTATTVLGWGLTEEPTGPTEPSDQLRQATVPLISDETCAEQYPQGPDRRAFDRPTEICAGVPQGGIDTCAGDSGGPLLVRGKVVGITSWGRGCARPDAAGVYTRVSTHYRDIWAQILR